MISFSTSRYTRFALRRSRDRSDTGRPSSAGGSESSARFSERCRSMAPRIAARSRSMYSRVRSISARGSAGIAPWPGTAIRGASARSVSSASTSPLALPSTTMVTPSSMSKSPANSTRSTGSHTTRSPAVCAPPGPRHGCEKTIVISHPWRGPGGAHTAGDLVVWLPVERVLFAGDLLIEDGVTMVVDGSAKGLLAALDTLAALAPRIAVPGHGAIPGDPRALIDRTREYMLRLRAAMRGAIERHRSLNRALDSLPPADEGRPVSLRSRERRNANRVYLEVEKEIMGLEP